MSLRRRVPEAAGHQGIIRCLVMVGIMLCRKKLYTCLTNYMSVMHLLGGVKGLRTVTSDDVETSAAKTPNNSVIECLSMVYTEIW